MLMKKRTMTMMHQKLHQIKMAISCREEINISFSSKFNLSPDRDLEGGRRSLLAEARGRGVVVVNMNKGW